MTPSKAAGGIMANVAAGGGADITTIASLVALWEADTLTGYSDGQQLTSWPDSHGANDLLTVDASWEPWYKAVGINGLPSVRMEKSSPYGYLGTSGLGLVRPFTLMMVWTHTNTTNKYHRILRPSVGTQWVGAMQGPHAFYAAVQNGTSVTNGGTPLETPHLSLARRDASGNSVLRYNGADDGSGVDNQDWGELLLGMNSSDNHGGWVSLIAAFSDDLDPADINTAETYANDKYAIF